jgi:putative heme-binding domain-containing protein
MKFRALLLVAAAAVVAAVMVRAWQQPAPPAQTSAPGAPATSATANASTGDIQFTTLPGFTIEKVTPPNEAPSLVVLTFDSLGRITVAKEFEEPRILVDHDKDGIFETSKPFTDKIVNCQGLWWEGRTLYGSCNGKGGSGLEGTGLYKMTDTNGDDVADAIERVTPLVGTIGDHGPHAIRRGPDGAMRLHVGNMSDVPKAAIDPGSPIRDLREGYLLEPYFDPRGHAVDVLAPGSQVYRYNPGTKTFTSMFAGMRNSYDHAYNLDGEAFTFDSDMEWDINLPWFRDTRTVHGVTGGEMGWRSGSRNLPAYYVDTLPPVRDLGRGSPVGVEFYQHHVYPKQFHDMLLEADWSRGRLLYTELTPQGSTYGARDDRAEFVHGEPLNITDLEVGPDGHVYFSAGGRTTGGAVYRIRYTGPAQPQPDMRGILGVVRQPQPLSSWGWAAIEKAKQSMGASFASELERVARDKSADARDRSQAIYIMQRHGASPKPDVLGTLITDDQPKVRAAAVYVAGVQGGDAARRVAVAALKDREPFVRRRALEALLVLGVEANKPGFVPVGDVYSLLADEDRFVRFIARVVLERTPRNEWRGRVLDDTNPLSAIEGMIAFIRTSPSAEDMQPLLRKQVAMMSDASLSVENKLRLVRSFQFAAAETKGGVATELRRQVHGALIGQFPGSDERLNRELAIALAYAGQPEAIGKILAAMPQGDENQQLQIHYAYALRAMKQGWTPEQKQEFMSWFAKAVQWRGGASFSGYLNYMFETAVQNYSDAEKTMAYNVVPMFKPVSEEELRAALARPGGGPPRPPGTPPSAEQVARARVPANARARGIQVLSREEVLEYQLFVPFRVRQTTKPGAELYQQACAKCHRFGAVGTDFGPDLTTITSRFKKKDMLEAMLWPSRLISDQYPATIIELKTGEIVNGLVGRETAQGVQLRTADAPDRPITIPKAQIQEQRQSKISLMPEGLLDEFSQEEIANLLSYLLSPPPGAVSRN